MISKTELIQHTTKFETLNETKQIISKMLLENTGVHMCDSGGENGRHWQINRANGIDKREEYPVEAYIDNDQKTVELEAHVNIYPFLIKHLDRTENAEFIENLLYTVCGIRDISIWSIFEIEELFKNDFLYDYYYNKYYDDNNNDFRDEYYDLDTPKEINPCPYFNEFEWLNTYNYDEYLSQTLQYLLFSDEYDTDYILLQIHNGADVRGGYTAPRVFEINDLDYFSLYQQQTEVYCDCGHINYLLDGHELIDHNGRYTDSIELYDKIYDDEQENIRCKKCGNIIKQYIPDF